MENETGIFLYTPNELTLSNVKGIPGFIDGIGLGYLRETQEMLGTPIYIAAGRCPNCGEIQMTIYSGFKTTNCLNCGFELNLAHNPPAKQRFLTECATIDTEYEEVTEEHDITKINYKQVGKTLFTVHIESAGHQWPIVVQNPWYKRYPNVILFKLKTLWQDILISMLLR